MKKGFAILLIAALSVTVPTAASATTRPAVDSSDAVRYSPDGSPIGDIVFELIAQDDRTKKLDAPFPLKFFGQRLPAICLSTNGLIYPIASTSSDCSPSYDKSLEVLTLLSQASSIAPLALDLDGSVRSQENLRNPHRVSTDELHVTRFDISSTGFTVTTIVPHGFVVGDRISLDDPIGRLFSQTSCGWVSNSPVASIISETTFTVSKTGCDPGSFVPAPANRVVVYREIAMREVTEMSLSGTTLTITAAGNNTFAVGRKFTLTGTGIPSLDQAKLTVASQIDASSFTATVPAGVTDLDSVQAGDQSTVTFASDLPWALERDDNGAIQQIYFGSTTIDGRDAYVITWYRVPTNDSSQPSSHVNGVLENPRTLTNTIQLVIIKGTTGSDANGWDFVYEFNIGHARDTSDGYLSTDPTNQCSVSNLSLCRWAMGTAQYFEGPAITTITYAAPNITINTATPHGRSVGEYVMATNLCSDLGFFCNKPLAVSSVIDADSLVLVDPDAQPQDDFANRSFTGSTLAHATAYELFPTFSALQLGDSGGSTALIRNSLNSNVLGRYTFGMLGGQIVDFRTPAMDGALPTSSEASQSIPVVPSLAATGPNDSQSLFLLASAGILILLGGAMLWVRRTTR